MLIVFVNTDSDLRNQVWAFKVLFLFPVLYLTENLPSLPEKKTDP